MKTRAKYRRGFTLLELIVAMGMVAILSASLYASLRVAFQAKQSAETAVEPSRTASVAMDLIRIDIQNTMPPGTNSLALGFTGSDGTDDRGRASDDLQFFSTADGPQHADANGEIKKIELLVVEPQGNQDHVLIRRVTRNLTTQNQINPDEEVICRGVAGFNLRYFDGTEWEDTWDSTQQTSPLPSAVEVTLELDRPTNTGGTQTFKTVRVFPVPCSTIVPDTGG